MKFVIFGAGGFLGKNLAGYLQNNGQVVWPVLRNNPIEPLNIDITNYSDFKKLDNINADIVINCASALPDIKSLSHPEKLLNFYNVNVVGGANIVNWASTKGIKKIINCSTLSVVNKPWPVPLLENADTYPQGGHAAYFTSKLSQEIMMSQIALEQKISIIHLRLSALYGPDMKWEGILPKLIGDFFNETPVNLNNGNKVSFNFLHVADLSKMIWAISKNENLVSGVYNTASPEEITLFKLASVIKAATRSNSVINNTDVSETGSYAQVDTDKLLGIINDGSFKFTPFKDGVDEMIDKYKTNIA